jgi:hypothetical protein
LFLFPESRESDEVLYCGLSETLRTEGGGSFIHKAQADACASWGIVKIVNIGGTGAEAGGFGLQGLSETLKAEGGTVSFRMINHQLHKLSEY